MKFLSNNKILDIYEAKQTDASKLHAFLEIIKSESVFHILEEAGLNKTVVELEGHLQALRTRVSSKMFLGWVKGQVIASGGIYHRDESIEGNVILDINVLSAYLGLGTEEHLLNHVINYARITSVIKSIDILEKKENKELIKLYHSLGFKEMDVSMEAIILKPDDDHSVFRLKIN